MAEHFKGGWASLTNQQGDSNMDVKPLTKQTLLQMVLDNNERNTKIVTWLILEVAKDDYQKKALSNSIGNALREQREELMNRLSDLL